MFSGTDHASGFVGRGGLDALLNDFQQVFGGGFGLHGGPLAVAWPLRVALTNFTNLGSSMAFQLRRPGGC